MRYKVLILILVAGLLIAGLFIHARLAATDNPEKHARKIVVEYFYGSDGRGGIAVSSLKGKDREVSLLANRIACHLDDSWEFLDDSVKIVDLGNYEFFARYTISFKKGADVRERTETFYFCGDTLWDAVPLTAENLQLNLDSESSKELQFDTLWEGDFDAFEERYRKP